MKDSKRCQDALRHQKCVCQLTKNWIHLADWSFSSTARRSHVGWFGGEAAKSFGTQVVDLSYAPAHETSHPCVILPSPQLWLLPSRPPQYLSSMLLELPTRPGIHSINR